MSRPPSRPVSRPGSRPSSRPGSAKPESGSFPAIGSASLESDATNSAMPLIPPKLGVSKMSLLSAPATATEEENWMYVMSPREVHGAKGPHSSDEMRFLYRMGDIGESTLVWTEGQKKWEKIENLPKLRYKLMTLPEIPSKKESNLEMSTANPILPMPTEDTALAATPLARIDKFHIAHCCSRCGAVAYGSADGHTEQAPDLNKYGTGKEVGFNIKFVAEIVPGFLWIGNQAASRTNNVEAMGITMSLCCGFDLNNPPNVLPKFRGHKTPLAEAPIPSDDPRTSMFHAEPLLDGAPTMSCSLDAILDCYEKAYDYIEMERLWHERAKESDVVEKKKPKGGPTDDYGRPVKSKYDLMDAMAAKRDFLFIKQMPCRVMVWCKNGVDRSCAVVIAYLIRKFGVTLPYAENIVNAKKKGVSINAVYMKALEEWSKKHSLGELLCDDCVAGGLQPESKYNVPTFEEIVAKTTEHLRAAGMSGALADVRKYMFVNRLLKHPSRFPGASSYYYQNVHIDLVIGGVNLQDHGLKTLLDGLSTSDAVLYLERIDLRNNGITCTGCGHLVDYLLTDKKSNRLSKNDVLLSLDLSHNRIGEAGAGHLSRLLQHSSMLLTLELTNNVIGDTGGAVLLETLVLPNDDIFEEDEDVAQTEGEQPAGAAGSFFVTKLCSKSLIELKIGGNQLGQASIQQAAGVVRSNMCLSSLTLDYGKFASSDLRLFMGNMRTFGLGLQRLSLNDINLSVDTVRDLFSVFEGRCPLSHLDLIRCGITKAHLSLSASFLGKSRFLRHLCLSNNNIEDEGVEMLAAAVREASENPMLSGFTSSVLRLNADEVEREISKLKRLNLQSVDVSCCGITGDGAASLVEALAHNKTLKVLDLSDNVLGGECINQLGALLLRSKQMVTLRMNRCRIQTKGGNSLLRLFADDMLSSVDNSTSDGLGLRSLEIAENEIKDSFSDSLRRYLEVNNVIQFLDLGFNELTDEGLRDVKTTLTVVGSSTALKKYNELHINLVGNPCDPYFLEMPNQSRAKATMRYSTHGSHSLSHVPLSTRDQFVKREDMQNKLNVRGMFVPKNHVA